MTHLLVGSVVGVLLLFAVNRTLEDCRGSSAVKPEGERWTLDCTGDCATPDNCATRNASDATGNFKHCGCKNDDVETCCNVILRPSAGDPAKWEPAKKGDCPSCGTPGICTLNTGTTEAQVSCDPIPH